jgi:hypothetical protein
MTITPERAIELLLLRAHLGDMGRKPDPNDLLRQSAALIQAQAAEIARLHLFASEVEIECNGHFNGDLTAEEALENIRKTLQEQHK